MAKYSGHYIHKSTGWAADTYHLDLAHENVNNIIIIDQSLIIVSVTCWLGIEQKSAPESIIYQTNRQGFANCMTQAPETGGRKIQSIYMAPVSQARVTGLETRMQ